MTQIRQVDIKNQYSLKRKESGHYQYEAGGSLQRNKLTQTYNKTTEPLQGALKAQISFKGSYVNKIKKVFNPILKPIPKKLAQKVFDSLGNISKRQHEDYSKILENYVSRLQSNENFRKKMGISLETANKMSSNNLENLYYIPEKKLFKKFLDQVTEPVTIFYEWVQKLTLPKAKLEERLENKRILNEFSSLQGLMKSHEIWENNYRKMSGNPKWNQNSKFLIPDDVLYSKINRRRKKIVDPNKGKYSTTSLMLGNRFISGVVYSYFLGTDAYNTTMRYSNDKHEAKSQRNSRVAQEFSRIGLNMYIQNLLFGTFSSAVNKSLSTALFVSGSTAACSEVLGRKLVGKPIMPSNKETLDRLEKEMTEKKGVLPAIGRLLTNAKKKSPTLAKVSTNIQEAVSYEKKEPNKTIYSAFSKNKKTAQNTTMPSFKGFFKTEQLIDKQKINKVLKALEKADPQEYKNLKEILEKALKKSNFWEPKNTSKTLNKNFNENGMIFDKVSSEKKLLTCDLDALLNNKDVDKLPIGETKTPWGQLTKSLMVPVNFVKNTFKSLVKSISKIYAKLVGKSNNASTEEFIKLSKSMKPDDKEKLQRFNEFYLRRLNLDVWRESSLSNEVKKIRIFDEFKEISKKDKEDIEGAKNILLWLDKQINREKITINQDGTLAEKDIPKVQKIMRDAVLKADGSTHVEYDGNTLAQTNINLSRAITTLFLVTDAYNLTMQYSGDNKKDASKSAKNRAAQEISRISVSAYLMAFVHNLLSKLCNSSLAGAFTLTALTSSINDSLSRKVVGVPLSAKNKEELEEIDNKNTKSKNPVKKALAYSIGKKGLLPKKKDLTEKMLPDFFDNDFFIKPTIS